MLGDHWIKRFLQRHLEYRRRRRRALDIEHQRAVDKNVLRRLFENYKTLVDQHGVQPGDIYNFDETGFLIGVGRDQWIFTREPRRKIISGSCTNREYITVVEAVSADGFVIPPLIILSGKTILFWWFRLLEDDEQVAVTDTGYINGQIAYQWVQHFEKSTQPRMRGQYRILICDRYGSHMTYEFVKFCEDHNTLLAFLPPHSSHLLQPLDNGVFNVFKHWHSEAIEAATAIGIDKFQKDDFSGIHEIRAKTFKSSTIKSGFDLTGLWPFDSDRIIDELPTYGSDHAPSPPSSVTASTSISTPKAIDRFKRFEDRFNRICADIDITDQNVNIMMQKLSKGAVAARYEIEQLRWELNSTTQARLVRDARYNASRRGIRSNATISSSQLRKMKRTERHTDDLKALDKLRPRWKQVMIELKRYYRMTGRRVNGRR
jgi:hypothetical protein